jgi:hypothetical protein
MSFASDAPAGLLGGQEVSASPSLGALPVMRRYIGAPIRSGVEG